VYALDRQPVAVTRIEEEAKKQGLRNMITILSDRETGLRDDSVDVVLFYGVLPEIKDKESVLRELHRVLKKGHIQATTQLPALNALIPSAVFFSTINASS